MIGGLPVSVQVKRPDTALALAFQKGHEGEQAIDVAKLMIVQGGEGATVHGHVAEVDLACALIEQALAEAVAEVAASLRAVVAYRQSKPGARRSRLVKVIGATWSIAGVYLERVEEILSGVPFHVALPEKHAAAVGVCRAFERVLAGYGSAERAGKAGPRFVTEVAAWVREQHEALDGVVPDNSLRREAQPEEAPAA